MLMQKHKHHIIPKHAGGTDSLENLVKLTIEEHAEAHKVLYKEYNRWQDRVAWLSLAGIMKDSERIYEIVKNSNRGNPSGYKHSDEIKKQLSELKIGKKNPMYNKPAHNRGIKRPGIGGRKKGTKWSEEEHRILKKIRSRPGYYDYLQDPSRCKKISNSRKGKIGAAAGKTWYNNGEKELYAFKCPAGFIKGRKKRKNYNKKGLLWYNNGSINRQFKEGYELKEFVRGRIN